MFTPKRHLYIPVTRKNGSVNNVNNNFLIYYIAIWKNAHIYDTYTLAHIYARVGASHVPMCDIRKYCLFCFFVYNRV